MLDKYTTKIWALTVPVWIIGAARVLLVAEIVLFFAATGLSAFQDVQQYKVFAAILSFQTAIERPSSTFLKQYVPTNFKGSDVARWLFVIAVYLASVMLGQLSNAFHDRIESLRRRRKQSEEESDAMSDLQKSLGALARGEKLDRRKLLQIYAETKKTLEGQKRYLAFLSIDVVDSTGMKVGESPEVAERDFILYKKLVERAFSLHLAVKSTWTPDGVMTCFATPDHAVEASLTILHDLKEFNRSVKSMKRDFELRIGINAGEVSFDEATPMEEMTDRVIDIAGHMQKHGAINAVSMSKAAVGALKGKYGFIDAKRLVDGCDVYESRGVETV